MTDRKENYTRAEVEELLERHVRELGPVPGPPPFWIAVLLIGSLVFALYVAANVLVATS